MKTVIKTFRFYIFLAFSLSTHATNATGPLIRVIEKDWQLNFVRSLEFSSNQPTKTLTKISNGKASLNIDPKNSDELEINQMISENLDFSKSCIYGEWAKFEKDNPQLSDWDALTAFNDYLAQSKIKLKSNEECFAEKLNQLLNEHPCLKELAQIEIQMNPIATNRELRTRPRGSLYITRVHLIGCPSADPKKVLRACSYKRSDDDPIGFGPGIWGAFVDKCIEAFQKPELRKMADQTLAESKR